MFSANTGLQQRLTPPNFVPLINAPKDKAEDEKKCGVVYRYHGYPCKGCDILYIGETKRALGDHIKEHCARTTSKLPALGEHSKNYWSRIGHWKCHSALPKLSKSWTSWGMINPRQTKLFVVRRLTRGGGANPRLDFRNRTTYDGVGINR